jgi:hypothetical protein
MSHILHSWEHPLPTSLDDAARIVSELARHPAPPNPRFAQLAGALAQWSAQQQADDPELGLPWVSGLPSGHSRTALWTVQVEPALADLAAQALVAAARPLGLVVFDDQRPALWLPDGRVLGDGAAAPTPATGPDAPLRSKAQVARVLRSALAPVLAPHGWAPGDGHTLGTLQAEAADFEIGWGGTARPPAFELALAVTVIPRLPPPWDTLARRWGDRGHLLLDELLARAGRPLPGPVVQAHVRYTRVVTVAELEAFAWACAAAVDAHVLPVLDSCRQLAGLEQRLNPPEGEPEHFVPGPLGLIVAACLGRPGLAALLDRRIAPLHKQPWRQDKLRQLAQEIGAGRPA